jgi:hypothetical protein
LIGYLVSGFFVTVFFYPYFWINFAMTAALHRVARSKSSRVSRSGPPGIGRRPPVGGSRPLAGTPR